MSGSAPTRARVLTGAMCAVAAAWLVSLTPSVASAAATPTPAAASAKNLDHTFATLEYFFFGAGLFCVVLLIAVIRRNRMSSDV
jgi:hypothetical protein